MKSGFLSKIIISSICFYLLPLSFKLTPEMLKPARIVNGGSKITVFIDNNSQVNVTDGFSRRTPTNYFFFGLTTRVR